MNSIYWGAVAQLSFVFISVGLIAFGLYAWKEDKNEPIDKR